MQQPRLSPKFSIFTTKRIALAHSIISSIVCRIMRISTAAVTFWKRSSANCKSRSKFWTNLNVYGRGSNRMTIARSNLKK